MSVDIYAKLLGLPPGRRPPDYYALLGVATTEANSQRIHDAARQRIAQLAPQLAGEHARAAQQLMSEIATARAVLTTPQGRERYDRKLRAQPDFLLSAVRPSGPLAEELLPPAAVDAAALPQTVGETAYGVPAADDLAPAPVTSVPRWSRPVEAPPQPPAIPLDSPAASSPRLVAGPGAMFNSTSAAPPAPADLPPLPPLAVEPPAHADNWSLSPEPIPTSSFAPPASQRRATKPRPGTRERERTQMALLLVLVCLLAVVVLGVGGLFVWQNNPAAVARQQLPQSDAGPPQERESTAQRNSARSSAASIAEVRQAAERQQMVGPNNSELRVADRDERAGNVTSRDERTPRASVMQKMPSPTTPGMSRPSISADTQTGDMPAKKDASMPAVAEVNSERAAAIRTSLTAARDALALGDLDKVDELLDQAMFDASTDTLRAQVEGVRAVRAYVGSFWNAVRESLKTVNSGTEIEIDGDIVIVVEISRNRDNLVVRMRGANRRFDVQQLPAELAVGLAQRWLDKDDVNSRAFIGTYLATSGRRDDAQRGRRMLNEAKGAGSEVAKTVLEHLDP